MKKAKSNAEAHEWLTAHGRDGRCRIEKLGWNRLPFRLDIPGRGMDNACGG